MPCGRHRAGRTAALCQASACPGRRSIDIGGPHRRRRRRARAAARAGLYRRRVAPRAVDVSPAEVHATFSRRIPVAAHDVSRARNGLSARATWRQRWRRPSLRPGTLRRDARSLISGSCLGWMVARHENALPNLIAARGSDLPGHSRTPQLVSEGVALPIGEVFVRTLAERNVSECPGRQGPTFPDRFGSLEHARASARCSWYIDAHHLRALTFVHVQERGRVAPAPTTWPNEPSRRPCSGGRCMLAIGVPRASAPLPDCSQSPDTCQLQQLHAARLLDCSDSVPSSSSTGGVGPGDPLGHHTHTGRSRPAA